MISTALYEQYPESFMTFHVFGMYYYLMKKFEVSRKHFNKAIKVNRESLSSWIMLGHCFAAQEESDQAMSVYRSCIRQFPGSHLPHLYIGMEYLRINNLKTALLSFKQAKKIAGEDPMVYNEIGCIKKEENQFAEAKKYFNKALKLCRPGGATWLKQILLNNLGNAHRKFREYRQAIICFEQCLNLSPNDPSVLFSLAFCYHFSGDLDRAIALYHKGKNFNISYMSQT